jgi:hypothetical protein
MQRADKNIDELLEGLNGTFHRIRQSGIDEELFDVIAGFEALVGRKRDHKGLRVRDQGNSYDPDAVRQDDDQ